MKTYNTVLTWMAVGVEAFKNKDVDFFLIYLENLSLSPGNAKKTKNQFNFDNRK